MSALAYLAQDLLGQATQVFGAAVAATTPASMSVLVNAGRIYQLAALEPSAWSSLAADSTQVLKQGILTSATLACPAPITAGFSLNYLIEGQYVEADTTNQTLSYWNAANPQAPFSGAGNNGLAQPTIRAGQFVVQAIAGVAATTGTQTTPATTAGWVPLAVVTVANGAATIVAGNIVIASGAPYASPLAQASGSFTLTATGLTTAPTGTCLWRSVGPMVTLILPTTLTGVSNATTFTATGLPTSLQPAAGMPTQEIALPPALNNTVFSAGAYASISAGSGTISFGFLTALGGWTNSGSKGVPSAAFTYLLY